MNLQQKAQGAGAQAGAMGLGLSLGVYNVHEVADTVKLQRGDKIHTMDYTRSATGQFLMKFTAGDRGAYMRPIGALGRNGLGLNPAFRAVETKRRTIANTNGKPLRHTEGLPSQRFPSDAPSPELLPHIEQGCPEAMANHRAIGDGLQRSAGASETVFERGDETLEVQRLFGLMKGRSTVTQTDIGERCDHAQTIYTEKLHEDGTLESAFFNQHVKSTFTDVRSKVHTKKTLVGNDKVTSTTYKSGVKRSGEQEIETGSSKAVVESRPDGAPLQSEPQKPTADPYAVKQSSVQHDVHRVTTTNWSHNLQEGDKKVRSTRVTFGQRVDENTYHTSQTGVEGAEGAVHVQQINACKITKYTDTRDTQSAAGASIPDDALRKRDYSRLVREDEQYGTCINATDRNSGSSLSAAIAGNHSTVLTSDGASATCGGFAFETRVRRPAADPNGVQGWAVFCGEGLTTAQATSPSSVAKLPPSPDGTPTARFAPNGLPIVEGTDQSVEFNFKGHAYEKGYTDAHTHVARHKDANGNMKLDTQGGVIAAAKESGAYASGEHVTFVDKGDPRHQKGTPTSRTAAGTARGKFDRTSGSRTRTEQEHYHTETTSATYDKDLTWMMMKTEKTCTERTVDTGEEWRDYAVSDRISDLTTEHMMQPPADASATHTQQQSTTKQSDTTTQRDGILWNTKCTRETETKLAHAADGTTTTITDTTRQETEIVPSRHVVAGATAGAGALFHNALAADPESRLATAIIAQRMAAATASSVAHQMLTNVIEIGTGAAATLPAAALRTVTMPSVRVVQGQVNTSLVQYSLPVVSVPQLPTVPGASQFSEQSWLPPSTINSIAAGAVMDAACGASVTDISTRAGEQVASSTLSWAAYKLSKQLIKDGCEIPVAYHYHAGASDRSLLGNMCHLLVFRV
jgi:hypothetical protein